MTLDVANEAADSDHLNWVLVFQNFFSAAADGDLDCIKDFIASHGIAYKFSFVFLSFLIEFD